MKHLILTFCNFIFCWYFQLGEQQTQEKEEACGSSPTLDVKQLKMVAKSGEASLTKNKKAVAGGSQGPYPRPVSCLHPNYRVGPGVSMLSSTGPVTHNPEAMDRFLQMLKRKPSPPAPDSPSPSTSKQ